MLRNIKREKTRSDGCGRTEYWLAETQVSYTNWTDTGADCLTHTRNPVKGLDWVALETKYKEGNQVSFTSNKQTKKTSICLDTGNHQGYV